MAKPPFVQFDAPENLKALILAHKDALIEEVNKTHKEVIKKLANFLEEKIRANISLTDHSLQDLEDLGHPYALKNVGVAAGLASSFGSIAGHKPFQVHIQENVIRGSGGGPGKLTDALGIDFKSESNEELAVVGIDETQAAHVEYVVLGTRYMVARDFFAATLLEVAEEMFDMYEKETGYRRVSIDLSL